MRGRRWIFARALWEVIGSYWKSALAVRDECLDIMGVRGKGVELVWMVFGGRY